MYYHATRLFILIAITVFAVNSSIVTSVNAQRVANSDEIMLILRADDIGSSHAANLACIRAAVEGVATSLEIMVPCPWFPEAATLLQDHPGIDVGVHLTLTSEWEGIKWGPLTCSPSLVDEHGYFFPMTRQQENFPPGTGVLEAGPRADEVEQEFRAQIERALELLPNVTHLTGHMGIADLTPGIRDIVDRLADEYGLPYELTGSRYFGSFPRGSIDDRVDGMIARLDELTPGLWLFVEHPGIDTPEMRAIGHEGNDDVAIERDAVTKVYTHPRLRAAIVQRGIRLISYAGVNSRQGTKEKSVTPRY